MRDDYLTSDWAAEHPRVSTSIHKLVTGFLRGLGRLQARQFDAPWRRSRQLANRIVR